MTFTVAWLLAELGSVALVLTLAVFGTRGFRTRKEPLIRTVALPWLARVPRLAVSVPVAPEAGASSVPWVVVADSNAKLSGRTSWSATLSAELGPPLITTIV